jgi:uncharacterized membrane protein
MTQVLNAGALALTAAAVVAGALVLVVTRQLRQALPVLLEFLTAAGLLRLSASPTWTSLLVAAAVVGLRHLLTAGLGVSASAGPARRTG